MRIAFPRIILALLCASGSVGLAHAAGPADTIRVMIVTGIDYPGHLWKQTTPVLRDELGKHRLTDGLASFDTDDELYLCLTGSKPVELLATARSEVTHRDEPMAFVHT